VPAVKVVTLSVETVVVVAVKPPGTVIVNEFG
jgi:hypothetical protein